ncbi:MAG: hypothetical protein B7Z06_01650 [Flavobacteriales bacterium 32-35-8]|nr:MAG: hypothetical protein B7Z06_01650 [Flavobacteriales bacterium 32-35-8]
MYLFKNSRSELHYFLSGTFYTALSSIMGLLVPVLLVPYIINKVGLESYGMSAVAFSVSYFFAMIVDYGFNITGVNKLAKETNRNRKRTIIINIIYTKILIFLILLPFCLVIYNYIISNTLDRQVYIMSLAIPLASVLNLSWALQGLHKIKTWSLITIFGQIGYIVLVYSFIEKTEDVILVNLFYGAGLFISGLTSLIYIRARYNLILIKVSFDSIKDELKGGYHFFLSNIGNYLSLYFLSPLVGYLISYEMAGVYSIIEKIYNIARRPFTIYQTFMLPKVSQQVSVSTLSAKNIIRITYIFVAIFIFFEIIVLFAFQEKIIMYFTDTNLHILLRMLTFALLGLFIVIINCPISLYLIALDRKKELMRMAILAPVFGLISGSFLIYYFGIIGSVFTLILVEIFYTTYLYVIYKRLNKVTEQKQL